MNALELADELEDCGKFFEDRLYTKAATMLCQQADRIAELEAKIDEMAGEIMTLENRMGMMGGYGHN
jgi:hypothetical protein